MQNLFIRVFMSDFKCKIAIAIYCGNVNYNPDTWYKVMHVDGLIIYHKISLLQHVELFLQRHHVSDGFHKNFDYTQTTLSLQQNL